ncbi:DUF362 domain-containing protein, partial [Candidatus Woesearchaeota archaeon]|nr:DUF362 domain-containing protein [Candidatus Woesearchaeota archaeon]
MITRWICEKDDKKWIYPVGKCLYCKEPVTKQKSTKAKIIGVTKVNIPSPMHPITPYTVILLEDEYGNRMPKKTMKNYDIGDEFSIKEAKNEDAVIVSKIKYNLDESLEESFSLMKNIAIKEGDKVLIKVSIIEPAYPYQAVTTNPKLLDSIISYLKSLGVNDIVVAEQSILGNTEDAAKKAGILNVCKKQEVEFVDLSTSEYEKKEKEGFEFNVAKEALERKIINVPVMKTHSQITVAGAMENLTRLTDKKTQYKIYKEGIGKTFSVLTSLFPDIVNVGDATIGMHGQGPTVLGEPA